MPNGNRTGARRWEAGSLSTGELDQVLVDALTELWTDSWRREQPTTERIRIFRRRVESSLYFATGQELWITTEQGRR